MVGQEAGRGLEVPAQLGQPSVPCGSLPLLGEGQVFQAGQSTGRALSRPRLQVRMAHLSCLFQASGSSSVKQE